jgi:hypothetical protein
MRSWWRHIIQNSHNSRQVLKHTWFLSIFLWIGIVSKFVHKVELYSYFLYRTISNSRNSDSHKIRPQWNNISMNMMHHIAVNTVTLCSHTQTVQSKHYVFPRISVTMYGLP